MKVDLSTLTVHPLNMRKANADTDITELAMSIASVGLIQPLTCVKDGDKYLVVAGQRRLKALQLLAKNGNDVGKIEITITKQDPIVVSTTENLIRLPPTPVDQFRAFSKMKGDESSIAEAFGCSIRLVKRRMALGRLPDDILTKLEEGDVSLEQAMVLTMCKTKKHMEEMLKQYPHPFQSTHMRAVILGEKFPVKNAAFDITKYKGRDSQDLFGDLADFDYYDPHIDLDGTDDDDEIDNETGEVIEKPWAPERYFTDLDTCLMLQNEAGEKMAQELVDEDGWSWAEFYPMPSTEIEEEYLQVTMPGVPIDDKIRATQGVILCYGPGWEIVRYDGCIRGEQLREHQQNIKKKAKDANAKTDSNKDASRGWPGTYSQALHADLKNCHRQNMALELAVRPKDALVVHIAHLCRSLGPLRLTTSQQNCLRIPDSSADSHNGWIIQQFIGSKRLAKYEKTLEPYLEIFEEINFNKRVEMIANLTLAQQLQMLAFITAANYHPHQGDYHDFLVKWMELDIDQEWLMNPALFERFNKPQLSWIMEKQMGFHREIIDEDFMKMKKADIQSWFAELCNDAVSALNKVKFHNKANANKVRKLVQAWRPSMILKKEDK